MQHFTMTTLILLVLGSLVVRLLLALATARAMPRVLRQLVERAFETRSMSHQVDLMSTV